MVVLREWCLLLDFAFFFAAFDRCFRARACACSALASVSSSGRELRSVQKRDQALVTACSASTKRSLCDTAPKSVPWSVKKSDKGATQTCTPTEIRHPTHHHAALCV